MRSSCLYTLSLFTTLGALSFGCVQDLELGGDDDVVVIDRAEPDDGRRPVDMGGEDPVGFVTAQMSFMWACELIGERLLCGMQTMLISTPGPLACLTSENLDVLPAGAGQYMVSAHPTVTLDETPGGENPLCPEGDYLIEGTKDCDRVYPTYLEDVMRGINSSEGCLVRFLWSEGGAGLGREVARSGLIQVRSEQSACVFDFEVVFAESPDYRGTFRLPIAELEGESRAHCVDAE